MAKILVIDDEELVNEMLKRRLEQAGFETISFFDAREALAYFEDHPSSIDLAIIDHNMPGINGTDLAERLRSMMPELPIIIMTGLHEGIEFGEYVVLNKPMSRDELLEAVKRMIR